jgi:hypothetical protein
MDERDIEEEGKNRKKGVGDINKNVIFWNCYPNKAYSR